jgi:CheY-like chemotaxis protein
MPQVSHEPIQTSTSGRTCEHSPHPSDQLSSELPVRKKDNQTDDARGRTTGKEKPENESTTAISQPSGQGNDVRPRAHSRAASGNRCDALQARGPPSPTILMVEDNAINMRILEMAAKRLKLDYDMAFDGSEAVRLFTESPLKYDIVWMDIMMPIMRGTVATQHIRALEKKAKRIETKPLARIVALTGLSGENIETDASGCGMDEFFTKPIKMDTLKRNVQQWRDEQSATDSGDFKVETLAQPQED